MEPFVTKNYVEAKGIEKLFMKIPDENFLVDVNNLLASKSLGEISADQVQDLAEKYKVKNVAQRLNGKLIQILDVFLKHHLGNRQSEFNDFNSAKIMQNILGISDSDFDKAYIPLAIEKFKKLVTETLNQSKKYQEVEIAQVEQLTKQLGLPASETEKMAYDIRFAIVGDFIEIVIGPDNVSLDGMPTFSKLCKDMDVPIVSESQKLVDEKITLWHIENRALPIVDADFLLQKDELCHFMATAKLYENQNVSSKVRYGEKKFFLKFIKGWYRIPNISARNTEDAMTLIDAGVLHITNQRIVFSATKGNITFQYQDIADLTCYPDGVDIVKETKKAFTFVLDQPDGILLTTTIIRIMTDIFAPA